MVGEGTSLFCTDKSDNATQPKPVRHLKKQNVHFSVSPRSLTRCFATERGRGVCAWSVQGVAALATLSCTAPDET